VEIFTRATRSELPSVVEMAPGVTVRHVTAGPFEGLAKEDLPSQLCAFANGVLRAEAAHPPGRYDLIHSHYWLSGQVGWLARERWGVPHVHTAHTLAKVKNSLIAGRRPDPKPKARLSSRSRSSRIRPPRGQHPLRGAGSRCLLRLRAAGGHRVQPGWTWTFRPGASRPVRPPGAGRSGVSSGRISP
jgi:hypothetical protein